MLTRMMAVIAALGLGWITYMIGMVLTVYDGFVSLILQPFMALFISGLFVVLALLVGLLLKIPVVSRRWTWPRAAFVAGVSLFILAFGYFLGLTYVGTNPETGTKVSMLHPAAAIGGYFFLLFAVANWPTRRKLLESEGHGGRNQARAMSLERG